METTTTTNKISTSARLTLGRADARNITAAGLWAYSWWPADSLSEGAARLRQRAARAMLHGVTS